METRQQEVMRTSAGRGRTQDALIFSRHRFARQERKIAPKSRAAAPRARCARPRHGRQRPLGIGQRHVERPTLCRAVRLTADASSTASVSPSVPTWSPKRLAPPHGPSLRTQPKPCAEEVRPIRRGPSGSPHSRAKNPAGAGNDRAPARPVAPERSSHRPHRPRSDERISSRLAAGAEPRPHRRSDRPEWIATPACLPFLHRLRATAIVAMQPALQREQAATRRIL